MRVFRFLVLQRGRGICPLICPLGVVAAAITAPGLGVGAWWQLVSFSGTREPQLAGYVNQDRRAIWEVFLAVRLRAAGGSPPTPARLGVRAGQGMILRGTTHRMALPVTAAMRS
jgi:hypothetical protein